MRGEQHWPGQQNRLGSPSPLAGSWGLGGPLLGLTLSPGLLLRCSSLVLGSELGSPAHSPSTKCRPRSCGYADCVLEGRTGDVGHCKLYHAAFKQGVKVNAYKNIKSSPGRFGSAVRASACGPERPGFGSR
uniref:Uncharacterized protein n=1 Tax=Molossus molossus TaxID=27622 RepID=A0A7J8GLD2_MOLMO|nr:hypothetical protein HJG59_011413 [Molossus molossus]